MLRRLILSLALGGAPVSPAIPQTVGPEPAVPKVECPVDVNHGYSGSAFRVGPNLILSVKHVTNLPNCEIDGVPIRILYTSEKADFSILWDNRPGKWLKVDCNGFVAGRKYLAIGHPRDVDDLVIVPMIATGQTDHGEALLQGVFTAQPGHSGGAIVDAETGAVVGTINTGDWEDGLTGSVELKGTPICRGNLA